MKLREAAALLDPRVLRTLAGRPPRPPEDLGLRPGDADRPVDCPALRPLVAAADRARATVAEWLRSPPRLVRAPDPTEWLEADRRPAPAGGAPLRVLSWNLGLLDRPYLRGRATVPRCPERSAALPAVLFGGSFDVLLLQEVWDEPDRARLRAAARGAGFLTWEGPEAGRTEHGLFLAVRADRVDPRAPQARRILRLDPQHEPTFAPGPGIRRHALAFHCVHAATGRPLQLVVTHLAAFPDQWRIRDLQARRLGLFARAEDPHAVVVLGADLNAAPFYAHDVLIGPATERAGWWSNSAAYALVRHYGALRDCFSERHGARDVDRGRLAPERIGRDRASPYGCPDWTARVPPDTFTATERNGLYRAQYAGREFPARLDHLLLGGPSDAAATARCELAFTEPRPLPGGPGELSDHYALSAELRLTA